MEYRFVIKGIEDTVSLSNMFNVIMVHTDGSLTEKTATDIEKLYTVCQFRNDTHFTCLTTLSKNGIQYQCLKSYICKKSFYGTF